MEGGKRPATFQGNSYRRIQTQERQRVNESCANMDPTSEDGAAPRTSTLPPLLSPPTPTACPFSRACCVLPIVEHTERRASAVLRGQGSKPVSSPQPWPRGCPTRVGLTEQRALGSQRHCDPRSWGSAASRAHHLCPGPPRRSGESGAAHTCTRMRASQPPAPGAPGRASVGKQDAC